MAADQASHRGRADYWSSGARRLATVVTAVVSASLLSGMPARAQAPADGPRAPQRENSVPVQEVPVKPAPASAATDRGVRAPAAVAWPDAGTAELHLGSGTAGSTLAKVGDWPILAGRAGGAAGRAAPRRVRVEVLDRSTTPRVPGVLLRVSGGDGIRGAGRVRLAVDYGGFRGAYGADWASRLRLVRLPECALTTPHRAGCAPVPMPSRNDSKAERVSGDVAADGGLYAVTAGPSGPSGDLAATALSPSATWAAGGSSGDFTWSYPLRMPPSTGGDAPGLALAYSSGSVDGRVASTNNQPSWVGEGFDLSTGFVERRYKSCADDLGGNNGQTSTGDLCWGTQNAFVNLGGKTSEVIIDGSGMRLKADDGSRVERLTSAPRVNADNDGEYWRITTQDGTQYFFGARAGSNAAWTVPVFGNHSGEDCYQPGNFAASACDQAYRWSLDQVVDPNGNTTALFYRTESNLYGRNRGQAAAAYHRGGWLERIEYGTHRDVAGAAPARVLFTTADRCITAGAACTPATPSNWPDVPWDQACTGGTCASTPAPTFWTQKRLAEVTTQVRDGTGYRSVDTWTLEHEFPPPGDTSSPALWLKAVRHNGAAGATVTFAGQRLSNRVDGAEGVLPLERYRVYAVHNGAGGTLSVTYKQPECRRTGPMPSAPDSNTLRCFPVFWTPPGERQLEDWFHKNVVDSVTEHDTTGAAPTVQTGYEYLTPPAWHHDDEDGLVPASRKTWSQFRGYGRVATVVGDGTGTRSRTETLYLRGMDGDRMADGSLRPATVTDSTGAVIRDTEAYGGLVREEVRFRSDVDRTVAASTITQPWLSGATATSVRPWGTETAHFVGTEWERERTALDGGGWRTTQVTNSYDAATGLLTQSSDLGDISVPTDDRCTSTWYAQNPTAWMYSYVSRVETVGVACGVTPSYPQDLLSDTRTFYDGEDEHGAAPTRGNVSRVEQAKSHTTAPVYVATAQATHDAYGRPKVSRDATGEATTTVYTPESGGPVTRTETSNPLQHKVTTDLDPAWGLPTTVTDANGRRTELRYDPLGRLSKVWRPGRATTDPPNSEYGYRVSSTGANVVTTKALLPDGTSYAYSYQLYDGLLRPRQTQAPSPGPAGGRILTDTYYDSRGLVVKANGPYYNAAPPDTALVTPVNDNDVPTQTRTGYDGLDRATHSAFWELGGELWRTTTTYRSTAAGDEVSVDPPAGGIPTTTVKNVRGQTAKLLQYTGDGPSGTSQTTTYTYNDRDQLATVEDPALNRWEYTYDLRGLKTQDKDADAGTTTYTHDDAGRIRTVTDGRNKVVAYDYDKLSRKIALRDGSSTGPKRVEWVFDTLPGGLGLPTSSTRFEPAGSTTAYQSTVDGYDSGGRPTGNTVTIPAVEEELAGSYPVGLAYHPDGSLAKQTLPAVGGLPAEDLTVEYTGLGLPSTLTGAAAYVKATSYTDLGELGQLTLSTADLGQKTWQTFYYERGTRRLSETLLETQTTSREQADILYSYDQVGNVKRIAERTATEPVDVQCFRYDNLRQLAEAWTPNEAWERRATSCAADPTVGALGGPAGYWHSYRNDLVGNRSTEIQHAAAGDTTRSYAYPAAKTAQPHTLRSVTTTRPGQAATTDTFAYNAAGATERRAVAGQPAHSLSWDTEGRQATDSANGQTTSFVYTPDGQRLIRRDPTRTTLYLGDTELSLNRATNQITGLRYYRHAKTTVGVRTGADAVSWLAADHHGTPQFAVDSSSLQIQRRRMLPFGGDRGTPPATWPGERGFVGGTADESTALVHLGARQYDPAVGRFISDDPITDTGDAQQINGYTYANGNPTTMSDPDGQLVGCSGPDGIGCRHAASRPDYGSPAYGYRFLSRAEKNRRYEQSRKAFLAKQRAREASIRKKREQAGTHRRCPDGARDCKLAVGSTTIIGGNRGSGGKGRNDWKDTNQLADVALAGQKGLANSDAVKGDEDLQKLLRSPGGKVVKRLFPGVGPALSATEHYYDGDETEDIIVKVVIEEAGTAIGAAALSGGGFWGAAAGAYFGNYLASKYIEANEAYVEGDGPPPCPFGGCAGSDGLPTGPGL